MVITVWQPIKIAGIPVRYFEGNVREALLEAGLVNNMARLQTTPNEKQNFAWRLVCMGGFSKRQLRETSGVSNGQIGNMRRVRKILGEDAGFHVYWWAADKAARGMADQDFSDEFDEEAYLDSLAEAFASSIRKATGTRLTSNPSMMARVVYRLSGRNAGLVLHNLEMIVPEYGREEAEEHSDF